MGAIVGLWQTLANKGFIQQGLYQRAQLNKGCNEFRQGESDKFYQFTGAS